MFRRRRCKEKNSLAIFRVLVPTLLHLQLLCAHHVRTDGSVSCPMELTQVNLNINNKQCHTHKKKQQKTNDKSSKTTHYSRHPNNTKPVSTKDKSTGKHHSWGKMDICQGSLMIHLWGISAKQFWLWLYVRKQSDRTCMYRLTSALLHKYGKFPPVFRWARLALGYSLYISSLASRDRALWSNTWTTFILKRSNYCETHMHWCLWNCILLTSIMVMATSLILCGST